jgi:hypothetical protein
MRPAETLSLTWAFALYSESLPVAASPGWESAVPDVISIILA